MSSQTKPTHLWLQPDMFSHMVVSVHVSGYESHLFHLLYFYTWTHFTPKCSGYCEVWSFHLFWGFLRFWEGVLQRVTCFFWSYAPEKETEWAQITTSYQHIISIGSYWKGCKGSVCSAIPTRINTLFKTQLHKKISPHNTWRCLMEWHHAEKALFSAFLSTQIS